MKDFYLRQKANISSEFVTEQPAMFVNLCRCLNVFVLNWSEKKHTTDDMLFTVETVSCLGACGLAPAMMVNDTVHPAMTPDKATELIKELKEEAAKS